MAQTKQPNRSPNAPAVAPTDTEFVTNVAQLIADRREFLKSECARIFAELTDARCIIAGFDNHRETLKVLATFNPASEFETMLAECHNRRASMLDSIKALSNQYDKYREEYSALLKVSPARKEAN